eukprot:jgi/Botrbrau1/14186/Bobra.182_3s0119.1
MHQLSSTVSITNQIWFLASKTYRAPSRAFPLCSVNQAALKASDMRSQETRTRRRYKPVCSPHCHAIYLEALAHFRAQEFEKAREAFQRCTELCPDFSSAWVSWAQMEKRCTQDRLENMERCRQVLQRGLRLNPEESRLCQSWGFMELQKGNLLAAVLLLERSVVHDPQRCGPVLRWQLVRHAQETVVSRRRTRRLQNELVP